MKEFDHCLSHAHSWLKLTQIKENIDTKYYRQRNLVCSLFIKFAAFIKFLFYCSFLVQLVYVKSALFMNVCRCTL